MRATSRIADILRFATLGLAYHRINVTASTPLCHSARADELPFYGDRFDPEGNLMGSL